MEFIAEIGLNYNANKGLISEMVRLASISCADFAKLQLGWRDKKGEINHLTKNDLESFIDICSYYQIKPLFSIFHFSKMPSRTFLSCYKMKPLNWVELTRNQIKARHGFGWSIEGIEKQNKVLN